MIDHASAQQELIDLLGLVHAPVAITFHSEVPDDANWFDEPMTEPTEDGRAGRAPASCVFWAEAHTASFTTRPEDHGNCSVGLYTHGLTPAEAILDKTDVGTLLEVGWVTMEAFGGVAALSKTSQAIGYGPLAESAGDHDVVLLRISPKQMMAIGDSIAVEFSGKPQCQIIPRAAEQNVVAASMGCALSRARIGMGDDELTVAVPAGRVTELLEGLRQVRQADDAVVGYALADKSRF
jgi:uncharacterized protein (DUF169 family)